MVENFKELGFFYCIVLIIFVGLFLKFGYGGRDLFDVVVLGLVVFYGLSVYSYFNVYMWLVNVYVVKVV